MVALAGAAVIAYAFAASMLNSTRIVAGRRGLSVRHEPLPWPGRWHATPGDVEQLFSEACPRRNGDAVYRVSVILRDHHRPRVLVDDLESPREALFVERRIERALRIVDRPVEGEL